MTSSTDTSPGMQRRNIYVGVALAFALFLAIYLVSQIREVVLAFLLALLLSIIISGPVNYLTRKGIGRGLGTLIVLGSLALVLVLAALALAPTVGEQARQLADTLPTLLSDAYGLVEQAQTALGLEISSVPDPQQLMGQAQSVLSGDTFSTILGVGASAASLLSLALVVLVSTIFMLVQPKPLVNGFVSFFPARRRERVREILGEMYIAVQNWFLGQLADMVLVGILYTVALSIIGVPFALLFGILGGLVCFVPFVGPIVSAVPPVIVALFQDPIMALWVLLVYLVIQLCESNLIQPVVMSRAVSLHPVVIVFALLIMGNLFAAVGILLAVPLVAALQVLVQELWTKRMDEKGVDPNPPREKEGPSKLEKGTGWLLRAVKAPFRRS